MASIRIKLLYFPFKGLRELVITILRLKKFEKRIIAINYSY